jgi:hypothetical protein
MPKKTPAGALSVSLGRVGEEGEREEDALKMDELPSHSGLSARFESVRLPRNQPTWSGKLTLGKPATRTSGHALAPPSAKL